MRSLGLTATELARLSASRRSVLQASSMGLLSGLGLGGEVARAEAVAGAQSGFSRAKACILVFMWGGPSHIDTWDPKPDAPQEIRGKFKPISTNVHGIQISEHFPKLAKLADQYTIVRSVNHDDPAHLSSVHHLMTGRHAPEKKSDAAPPSRRDWPHIGSTLMKLRPPTGILPQFVMMPWSVLHPAAPGGTAPGQHGGLLGPGYDPFVLKGDPNASNFEVPGIGLPVGLTLEHLQSRRALLDLVDGQGVQAPAYARQRERALDLVAAPQAREAFDLSQETPATRERYGRHIHGQCLLLARRLVERDVPLVCVNWHNDGANFWDSHGDVFNRLKNDLMPPADNGFSALLQDLQERGRLEDTLVVWVGEFGRAPQINKSAGRDHFPYCYSAVLAGAGIRGGQLYGKSDARGAAPVLDPVSPADIAATMYHALGVPADFHLADRQDRPLRLTEGQPLPLFG